MALLALLACALPAGCAAPAPVATPACTAPMTARPVVELFFGRGMAGGGEVGDGEWRRFLDEEVTRRFPEGLTVLDAAGQYREGGAVTRERSKLVLIVPGPGPSSGTRTESAIGEIIAAYKSRFAQNAVLRIDVPGCVGFL